MGEIRIEVETRTAAERGAVQHLQEALSEAGATEKDFHVKQALQLLDVNAAGTPDTADD